MPTNDPAMNIATEKYLCERVGQGEVIMLLWRNAHTVVIGRNQNAWRECNIDAFRKDGGNLVRRLSGGGAVYHDLGNVNYTFLAQTADYDVTKQNSVLIEAAASFGINVERTGRNDLTVDGRKMSGNAFYSIGEKHCHHGTILVDTDFALMGKYLNTPGGKMSGKGVTSVKSRVANLIEFADVNPDSVEKAMVTQFSAVYGCEATEGILTEDDNREIRKMREQFINDEWTLGKITEYNWDAETRFDWGAVQLHLTINAGVIITAHIFSDALDADCIDASAEALIGVQFNLHAMQNAVEGIGSYGVDIAAFMADALKSVIL